MKLSLSKMFGLLLCASCATQGDALATARLVNNQAAAIIDSQTDKLVDGIRQDALAKEALCSPGADGTACRRDANAHAYLATVPQQADLKAAADAQHAVADAIDSADMCAAQKGACSYGALVAKALAAVPALQSLVNRVKGTK